MAYATDRDNYLPPAHYDLITRNRHRWHGTRNNPNQAFNFTGSPLRQYVDVEKLKLCPKFEPTPGGHENGAGGYGYNAQYLGSSLGLAAGTLSPVQLQNNFGNRPARLSMVRRPAETIMFTDVAFAKPNMIEYSYVEPPTFNGGIESSPSIHFRHRGSANVVWLDGHTTSEKMTWTYKTNVHNADNERLKLGFFGPRDNSLFDRE
jgi:prepilin-type processing-associated H-X9-DG protein